MTPSLENPTETRAWESAKWTPKIGDKVMIGDSGPYVILATHPGRSSTVCDGPGFGPDDTTWVLDAWLRPLGARRRPQIRRPAKVDHASKVESEDVYASGWERGYLAAVTDVAGDAHRVGDLTARGKLHRILTDLTSQMRVYCERYDVGAS